ncbi:LPXTG cell wall anchor domain-containing protein [Weissella muntiaci]|uniref:LPXTG cell wall anchor domain-containing protein n=1 Tax=Weissella muntiaci TaxID=2508881 RepID=A0A6C2C389_9LACO|nr:MucBP domain-containing protein [Weissella muntiaci]TYC47996.1 LPXTG cell wall anchor domain-containing protein [Weissella muntiaci]
MKKALLFAATLLSSIAIGLSVAEVHVNVDAQVTSQSSASNDDPQQMGTVTYQFIDMDNGEKIRDDETLTGKVGDTWSYDPRKHVHDYQMPNAVAFDGTFTVEPQVIKAFFTPAKDGSLNVYYKYSDQSGKEIKTTDSTTYGMWENFQADINKFELKDWELDLDKSIYSIDFGVGNKIEVPLRQLAGTNSLANTVSQIQASPGYGSDATIGFDLVYTRVQSNVTANYVDENGNSISNPKVMTGNVGNTYSFETQDIEGYSLSSVSGPISGTYGNEDQTVTYVYKKIKQDVTDSQIVNKDSDTDNSSLSSNVVANKGDIAINIGGIALKTANLSQQATTPFNNLKAAEMSNQNSLPDTGSNPGVSITLAGLSMLVVSLMIILKSEEY